MNTDQTNDKPIVLRCNEDGLWEKYEPYMTIDCPTEEDYNFIVRAIEHYKQSEWISVEERLPDNNMERVLVFLMDDDFTKPIGDNKIDTDRFVDGKWVRWSRFVTHWMPLPEPPKGD